MQQYAPPATGRGAACRRAPPSPHRQGNCMQTCSPPSPQRQGKCMQTCPPPVPRGRGNACRRAPPSPHRQGSCMQTCPPPVPTGSTVSCGVPLEQTVHRCLTGVDGGQRGWPPRPGHRGYRGWQSQRTAAMKRAALGARARALNRGQGHSHSQPIPYTAVSRPLLLLNGCISKASYEFRMGIHQGRLVWQLMLRQLILSKATIAAATRQGGSTPE